MEILTLGCDVELVRADCLDAMNIIPDKTVDMVLCDLPYGVLNRKNKSAAWDVPIPMDKLWKHYERICKDNAAIVLFGSGMFTSNLMQSNPKMWRYNLIWDKCQKSGFLNAKRQPLRKHEDILVFYKKQPTYNPQMEKCEPHKRNHSRGDMKNQPQNNCYGKFQAVPTEISDEKFPTSIITVSKEHRNGAFFHPNQKPVALCEYLIKTYTDENALVLDNCMGSGSTGVACINTKRRFIGIEKDEDFYNIAVKRCTGGK